MQSRVARIALAAAGALLLGTGATGGALAFSRLLAGPQRNGTGVTPNGWLVTPAGQQLDLADQVYWADRPDGQALSPDGRTLLISSGGQSIVTMKVVDTATRSVQQTIPYPSPEALFIGVVWSPDGKLAFASAGGNNKVRTSASTASSSTRARASPFRASRPDLPCPPMDAPCSWPRTRAMVSASWTSPAAT